jgi:hypothetical protein
MDRAVRMKQETVSHQLANKYTVPGMSIKDFTFSPFVVWPYGAPVEFPCLHRRHHHP